MALEHKSREEARDHFQAAFDSSVEAEGWMAGVWKVQDGRLILERCTRYRFPDGDNDRAVEQLKEAILASDEPQPLEMAAGFEDDPVESQGIVMDRGEE